MSEDEESIYEFCDELRRNQSVSDATYASALNKFGEQGVIDLVSLNGYYSFLAMVADATRQPLRKGVKPGLVPLPH
jgi:4-carboxymuconolactone decarboxylase